MNNSTSSRDQTRRAACCQQVAVGLKINACISENRMCNKSILAFSKKISGLEDSENFQQSNRSPATLSKVLGD